MQPRAGYVVFRTVDDKLIVNEEFIGLYSVDLITADVLTAVIKDVMLRLNLAITKLCGQCYDGCSTMSGSRSGVAKRIMEEECKLNGKFHLNGNGLLWDDCKWST